jgi:hypothetical protein
MKQKSNASESTELNTGIISGWQYYGRRRRHCPPSTSEKSV